MDHPALEIATRLKTPPSQYQFLGTPSYVPHTTLQGVLQGPTHYLFLGQIYPVDNMDQWPNDLKTVLLFRPKHYGLQMYAKFLREALEDNAPGLGLESVHWLAYKRLLMRKLIEPDIDHAGEADHWLWRPAFRNRHPTMNWGGQHDLLVVRFTWALERTSRHDILPPNKQPRQGTPECPNNSEYRRCVNPYHYYVPWTRRDRRLEAARAEDSWDIYLRGQSRLRDDNPPDWKIKADLDQALLEKGYTNAPPPEAPPAPEVDLVDWSQYPDI